MSERIFAAAGGLCGASGVALAGLAAHVGGANAAIAAGFLLAHAPALLAIGLFSGDAQGRRIGLMISAGLLVVGLILFCGDLLLRDYAGQRLFIMAAPAGGSLLIGGWLAVAVSTLLPTRAR